jgi:cardiolipin synthase A/B
MVQGMFPIAIPWSSPVLESLVAALYVLLAGIVTADVLLKKNDVRAELGWIAAAWFSPILGSLLYYMFGINRVTRRALRMGRLDDAQATPPAALAWPLASPNIALLSDLSGRVTGSPLTSGNRLEILQGGDEAYPAMLAAIEGARHSVALASYIFRNDKAGNAFAAALIAAHKRGVKVRVLLDSVGIGYIFPLILYRLKRGGVCADRFLHTWLPWRMPFLNMRNHRKLLVVDGGTAFVGGMNVGAENYRAAGAKHYVQDIHFRIDGPIARTAMDAFARDWTFTTEETLDDPCWWPNVEPQGQVLARGLRSGPDADIYKLELILGGALTLAKRRIRIVTPYFLPDQRLQFAIAQACLRGVQVDIVIPEHCDYTFMDWAMRAHLRFFKHIAVNLYITPLPFDHSKLVTMDGEWCLIGSSNWDARSFRLNFEFDLECCDPGLAGKLHAIIDAKIASGRRLTPEELLAQPVWIRLRDAAARLLMPYL